MTTLKKKKDQPKKMVVTGKQTPLTVDLLNGEKKVYEKGDEFMSTDWPVSHVTIPDAIRSGLIVEVSE